MCFFTVNEGMIKNSSGISVDCSTCCTCISFISLSCRVVHRWPIATSMQLTSPFFGTWISVFFRFFKKYYHILFIAIVFRLGSDKLVSCLLLSFPKESVTGCDSSLGGWVVDFSFSIVQVIFVFCLLNFTYFSILYTVLPRNIWYYYIR